MHVLAPRGTRAGTSVRVRTRSRCRRLTRDSLPNIRGYTTKQGSSVNVTSGASQAPVAGNMIVCTFDAIGLSPRGRTIGVRHLGGLDEYDHNGEPRRAARHI